MAGATVALGVGPCPTPVRGEVVATHCCSSSSWRAIRCMFCASNWTRSVESTDDDAATG